MEGERLPHAELVNDRARLIMHRLIVRHLRQNPNRLAKLQIDIAERSKWAELHSLEPDELCCAILHRTKAMREFRKSSATMGVLDLTDYDL